MVFSTWKHCTRSPKLVGTHAQISNLRITQIRRRETEPRPTAQGLSKTHPGPKISKNILSRLLAKIGTGVPLWPKTVPWHQIHQNSTQPTMFDDFSKITCLNFLSHFVLECFKDPNLSPNTKFTATQKNRRRGLLSSWSSSSGEEIGSVGKVSRRAPWIDTPGQGVTTSLPHHHPLYLAAARTSISSNKPHGRLHVFVLSKEKCHPLQGIVPFASFKIW